MVRRDFWCVEQLVASRTWRRVRFLGRKSGRLSFGRVTEVENVRSACKGTVHLSFTPSQLFILNQGFQDMKPELLDLQIQQDFIDQGLAPEGVEFLHRKKQLSDKSGRNHFLSTFAPESELESLYTLTSSWVGIHQLRLLPGIVAIAGLIRLVTRDPVLVLLLDPKKYQLVAVKDGIPLYNQRLSPGADGLIDMSLVPHALDFAAQILKREYEISECRFSCLGRQRESFDPSLLPELESWLPDFSSVVTSENPEDILSFPQLFGVNVADEAYDYTPVEFSRSWKLQGLARVVGCLSGLAAIGALAGWYLLQDDLGQLRAQYMQLSRTVADQRFELTSILPKEERFQVVDRLISLRSNASKELRLDDLVRNIARSLAPEVRISALKVDRQKKKDGVIAPPPDTENLSVAGIPMPGDGDLQGLTLQEELQKNPLQVQLTCMIRGSYDIAAARIQDTIVALSRVFTMQNVHWRYVEKERRGYLSCDLFSVDGETSRP